MFLLFLVVVVSVVVSQECVLTNYNFTQTLNVGWTIGYNDYPPYIDGENNLILGDTVTEQTGNSSVYQDFTLTSCDQNITMVYTGCTQDNNYLNDQQELLIKNPANDQVVVTLVKTLIGFNAHPPLNWVEFSCNVCNGSCGNVNLIDIGISPLRLELLVHQNGNGKPTAMIVNEVCIK